MGHRTRRNDRNLLAPLTALFLLMAGAYLIATAMLNPMKASDMEVLGGAFTFVLSGFFLVYLVRPHGSLAHKTDKVLPSRGTIHRAHFTLPSKPLAHLEMTEEMDHSPQVVAGD
jgi:hypothetical protein